MSGYMQGNKNRIAVFLIIVSLIGIAVNGYRISKAIPFLDKCTPKYIGITLEEKKNARSLHDLPTQSTIDETTKEAKAARKAEEAEFKKFDSFGNYKKALALLVGYIALAVVSGAFVIVGISFLVNYTFNSKKQMIAVLCCIVAVLVIFAGAMPVKELDYIWHFSKPVIYYTVP